MDVSHFQMLRTSFSFGSMKKSHRGKVFIIPQESLVVLNGCYAMTSTRDSCGMTRRLCHGHGCPRYFQIKTQNALMVK
jgi:hypothetical protein